MHKIDNLVKLSQVLYLSPKDLKEHPVNHEYFGEFKTQDYMVNLRESILKHGILEPIIITKDNTIISGHSRHMCSMIIGMKTVPVRVIESKLTNKKLMELMVKINVDSMMTDRKIRIKMYGKIIDNFQEIVGSRGFDVKRTPLEIEQITKKYGIDRKTIAKDINCIRNQANYHHKKDRFKIKADIEDINVKFIDSTLDILSEYERSMLNQNQSTIKEAIDTIYRFVISYQDKFNKMGSIKKIL